MQAQEVIRRQAKVERDMDLIRDLMLAIEKNPEMDYTRQFPISHPALDIPGYSPEQVSYHAKLLLTNDYVKGNWPFVSGLTMEGHDFLDNIRDPGVWKSAKQR